MLQEMSVGQDILSYGKTPLFDHSGLEKLRNDLAENAVYLDC